MDDDHHLIYLTGNDLTIEDVINVAESGDKYKVAFPEEIINIIKKDRKSLDYILTEYPEIKIYGTNRLHGDLKNVDIKIDDKINYKGKKRNLLEVYQEKYINVHNCGTGELLTVAEVRAIMLIRLNSFARGYSAMCWETVGLLIELLNRNVTPVVLEEGSVGASGDLIPLAMIAATMIGLEEAEAFYYKERMSAKLALEKAGLIAITLKAKEAMGLTNGSNFITALAVFAISNTEKILKNASISAALSLEAIRGEKDAFSKTINEKNRKHHGQVEIANQILRLTKNSRRMSYAAQMDAYTNDEEVNELNELLENCQGLSKEGKKLIEKLKKEKEGEPRVQDRYSFRSVPQVHGVTHEALQKLKETITIEINSATDNPLFDWVTLEQFKEYVSEKTYNRLLEDKDERIPVKVDNNGKETKMILKAYSGANFHGQPLATVIDYLKIALTSLALITDKRTYSLLDKSQSFGLPADLAVNTSKADGGLMIAQYAGAARVAECRVLSTPASVTSVATSANQEDFVSMGSIGVLHLKKIIYNTQLVISIEMLCAMRGIQLTKKSLPKKLQKLGDGTAVIYEFLINKFGEYKEDMYLKKEIDDMFNLVKDKNNDLQNIVNDLLI